MTKHRYRMIDAKILRLIAAESFLQLINAGLFLIFNFLCLSNGYGDNEIAEFFSWRFLSVMMVSLPLGFYIRKRKIVPLFRAAAILVPLSALGLIWGVKAHHDLVVIFSSVLIGVSTSFFQMAFVPFLMRNTPKEWQTEAIALHFASWSTTTFVLGAGSWFANWMMGEKVPEEYVLWTCCLLGFLGGLLFYLPIKEVAPEQDQGRGPLPDIEWRRMAVVLLPGLVIGIGAGLTIPFISIYFHNVFEMEYDQYSIMSSISTLLVTFGSVGGPWVLRRYGYGISVIGVQSLAVVALFIMAAMENYAPMPLAFGIACFCYMVRQPLMNMANPILSQLTMDFVGPKSRELTSAIQQALWSGSWFFSSHIFAQLRSNGYTFNTVLTITGIIYSLGIALCGVVIVLSRRDAVLTQASAEVL